MDAETKIAEAKQTPVSFDLSYSEQEIAELFQIFEAAKNALPMHSVPLVLRHYGKVSEVVAKRGRELQQG